MTQSTTLPSEVPSRTISEVAQKLRDTRNACRHFLTLWEDTLRRSDQADSETCRNFGEFSQLGSMPPRRLSDIDG